VRSLLFILFFWISLESVAQADSGYLFIRSLQGDIADVSMDNLDNLYIISSTGQVRKFNNKGDSAGIYNQVRNFGKLHSMDISNSLKPVLFYKDFSTIVILDRFLSQRSILDLRKVNILQASAAALSYDNQLWVFDEFDNKLKKVDDQGNLILSTPDFRMIFNENIRPTRIMNDNGLVYLADTAKGVYVFDNYGTFKKKLPVIKWNSIAVKEHYIIYAAANELTIHNSNSFFDTRKPFPSTFQNYSQTFLSPGRLILFSKDALHIYKVNYH
jgi:hypothetical protein